MSHDRREGDGGFRDTVLYVSVAVFLGWAGWMTAAMIATREDMVLVKDRLGIGKPQQSAGVHDEGAQAAAR